MTNDIDKYIDAAGDEWFELPGTDNSWHCNKICGINVDDIRPLKDPHNWWESYDDVWHSASRCGYPLDNVKYLYGPKDNTKHAQQNSLDQEFADLHAKIDKLSDEIVQLGNHLSKTIKDQSSWLYHG